MSDHNPVHSIIHSQVASQIASQVHSEAPTTTSDYELATVAAPGERRALISEARAQKGRGLLWWRKRQ